MIDGVVVVKVVTNNIILIVIAMVYSEVIFKG